MRAGREFGSKPGSGGQQSAEWSNVDRRERMRQIAMERIGNFFVLVLVLVLVLMILLGFCLVVC